MSDINEAPEVQPESDELDAQDLEDVAGGVASLAPADDINGNCGTNCHC